MNTNHVNTQANIWKNEVFKQLKIPMWPLSFGQEIIIQLFDVVDQMLGSDSADDKVVDRGLEGSEFETAE